MADWAIIPPPTAIRGMPRMMSTGQYEYVIASDTTYPGRRRGPLSSNLHRRDALGPRPRSDLRRLSIGQWIDEDGDGRYDILEVETRGPFKGPRAYDGTGLPLHFDNESCSKSALSDKANPNILHNLITVIDHALTRPWTVDKTIGATQIHVRLGGSFIASRATSMSSWEGKLFLSAEGL
jgi:hypothetical protein